MSRYVAARRVTCVCILAGWLFAGLGGFTSALVLCCEVVAFATRMVPVVHLGVGFPIIIGMFVAGLFVVLCSWMARAVFDVAEHVQNNS